MAQTSHLKRRGSTYYAQLAVPLDLQTKIGRKTMDRSLRTKDPHEAKRLLPDVLKDWHRAFNDAKRGAALAVEHRRRLTPAQFAAREYQSGMALDAELRASDDRYAAFGVDYDTANEFRAGYTGRMSDDELERLVGWRIARFRAEGIDVPAKGEPEWREIAQAICVGVYESEARRDERDNGEFDGKPSHPTLTAAEPEEQPAPKGEGILDLFDVYVRENAKGVSADTLNQARRDVKLFADTVGSIPATKIAKKHVRDWKALLMEFPVKAAEIAAFRGMTMKQVVQANKKVGKPTISDGTVNRYLSGLSAYCDWLVRNDYLDRNPVDGLFQFIDKTKRQKETFTVEQMNTLFSSPLFTGCRNDDDWHQPGNHMIRDHRYWLPLVMLYSGARPAEIAQLLVDDVREIRGEWVLHITELGDDEKSVKTKGSMRVVPVHPELVKLGFLKYRDAQAGQGEKRLFPKATRNSRGQMVADFSRDFGRYLIRLGMKEGRGLSLYSFRHGFIDALRTAGYPDEESAFLVGHTKHTTTGMYGNVAEGTLRQRAAMVKAVRHAGLKLGHLEVR